MTEPVPPIGTQVSRLAELGPNEPAVTCDGHTLTRGDLDHSTNRLARIAAYKVPRTVEFVDAPLRDDADKARRSAVRAEVMARLRPLEAG